MAGKDWTKLEQSDQQINALLHLDSEEEETKVCFDWKFLVEWDFWFVLVERQDSLQS